MSDTTLRARRDEWIAAGGWTDEIETRAAPSAAAARSDTVVERLDPLGTGRGWARSRTRDLAVTRDGSAEIAPEDLGE